VSFSPFNEDEEEYDGLVPPLDRPLTVHEYKLTQYNQGRQLLTEGERAVLKGLMQEIVTDDYAFQKAVIGYHIYLGTDGILSTREINQLLVHLGLLQVFYLYLHVSMSES